MAREVEALFTAEYEIKRSKFLAYLNPFTSFELQLKALQKSHPKARHYVWAYRYEKDGVLFEKQSDDGEPKGTAGKPLLNVLQKQDILNSALIVVRYFGGIKLGANGLVKAYSKAASLVIQKATLKEIVQTTSFSLLLPVSRYQEFCHYLSSRNLSHTPYFLGEYIKCEVVIPLENLQRLQMEIKSICGQIFL